MLNLHEMERLPPWIENMPVEARDKRDIQNAMQHQKKQGKKGNSQKVQREARINCKSKDVYMQINLNDLEAYTQDVLKNERDRQRLCWCRAIVVCLSLTIFAIGVGAAIMTEDIQSQIFDQLPKQYKNSIRVPPPPTGNNSNTNQTYSHNIAMENPAAASTTAATKPSSSESQEKSPAASTATATPTSNATSTTEENPRTSLDETAAATTATTTPAVSQTEEKPAASTVTTYASNVTSEAHHQPQEQEPTTTTATTTATSPPASSSSSTSSPAHAQQQEAEEDPSYILSTCEREVNSNHSFSFLLQRIQSHDTDVPMCRPEVR